MERQYQFIRKILVVLNSAEHVFATSEEFNKTIATLDVVNERVVACHSWL